MAHADNDDVDAGDVQQPPRKRPRSPPPSPSSDSAEALLLEAQGLMEREDPDDAEAVICLLERCIAVAGAATTPAASDDDDGGASGGEDDGSGEDAAASRAVVPSLAHTWLAKIREQQEEEDGEEVSPASDAWGPAVVDAVAHYEAALACWSENATAAYALARLRRPRIATPVAMAEYERLLRTAVEHAPEEDAELCRQSVEDLALLLIQQQEQQQQQEGAAAPSDEATALLRDLGFTHRLSSRVLSYTLDKGLPADAALGPDAAPFLKVFDEALAPAALAAMQEALAPSAPFWREHGYWRPAQGYFSYLLDLQNNHDSSGSSSGGSGNGNNNVVPPEPRLAIEAVIRRALFPLAVQAFPEVAKATTAEWWAHCRRHSSAHQLHYDSLDEGRGFVQHPIASVVLYLTGDGVGGPTLMTDQRLGSGLATRGWFCHARPNRVCVFDAAHLHGVVPGRGLPPLSTTQDDNGSDDDTDGPRRITFMVGFWRHPVKPKPLEADGRPGASMDLAPLLLTSSASGPNGQPPPAVPAWVAQGRKGAEALRGEGSLLGPALREGRGGLEGPLPCVWERLDGGAGPPGSSDAPAPKYEECFQGF